MVVNNRSSVLMLQFAEVHWDYSASAVRNFFAQSHVSPENVLQNAERMTRGSSSRIKYRSHHFKSLSTPSMQHPQGTTFQMGYSQIYIQNTISNLCLQWFMNSLAVFFLTVYCKKSKCLDNSSICHQREVCNFTRRSESNDIFITHYEVKIAKRNET